METEINRKTFSIEDIIASSWRLTWENIGVLAFITFIAIVIYAVVHLFTATLLEPIHFVGPFLAAFINLIVGCVFRNRIDQCRVEGK